MSITSGSTDNQPIDCTISMLMIESYRISSDLDISHLALVEWLSVMHIVCSHREIRHSFEGMVRTKT